jgi:hypothetical protein
MSIGFLSRRFFLAISRIYLRVKAMQTIFLLRKDVFSNFLETGMRPFSIAAKAVLRGASFRRLHRHLANAQFSRRRGVLQKGLRRIMENSKADFLLWKAESRHSS